MQRSRRGNSARRVFQSAIWWYSAPKHGPAAFRAGLFKRPYEGVNCRTLAVCARPGRSRSPLAERALFPGRRTELISEMRAPSRLSYGRIPNLVELKDLIATQLDSFNWFKTDGLRELFDEIN